MREVLFRGKRKDNGEWVYGSLQCFKGFSIFDAVWKNWFTVSDKTIGQYTGLHDKNDKKIFEGDIISIQFVENEYLVEDRIYYENGEVYFDTEHYGWYVRIYDDFLSLWEYDDSEIAVIGNIYDNPELMEK